MKKCWPSTRDRSRRWPEQAYQTLWRARSSAVAEKYSSMMSAGVTTTAGIFVFARWVNLPPCLPNVTRLHVLARGQMFHAAPDGGVRQSPAPLTNAGIKESVPSAPNGAASRSTSTIIRHPPSSSRCTNPIKMQCPTNRDFVASSRPRTASPPPFRAKHRIAESSTTACSCSSTAAPKRP